MAGTPPIRRLALIPSSGPGDPVRRYKLARLEEVAWPAESDERAQPRGAPGEPTPEPTAGDDGSVADAPV